MKRTMAAVIVGPSIEPSASVFASERARYGTAAKGNWRATEAVKANMAEQGYDLCPVKAERGCFEVKARDQNGARLELDVTPEAGVPIQSESCSQDRS